MICQDNASCHDLIGCEGKNCHHLFSFRAPPCTPLLAPPQCASLMAPSHVCLSSPHSSSLKAPSACDRATALIRVDCGDSIGLSDDGPLLGSSAHLSLLARPLSSSLLAMALALSSPLCSHPHNDRCPTALTSSVPRPRPSQYVTFPIPNCACQEVEEVTEPLFPTHILRCSRSLPS